MKQTIIKSLVFILLVGLIVSAFFFLRDHIDVRVLQQRLDAYGWVAPFIFIGLYITATVLFLPGSVLTLTGGLLFGPWWGTLYNITGAVIGSSIAFLISRYLAGDWVARKSGNMLGRLLRGVEREGWRFVAFVRLIPLFPFNLLNYTLGLTPIRLITYVVASAIFMLPGTFAYTYVGSLGYQAMTGRPREIVTHVLIAIGLVVLVAALPRIIKAVRGKGIEDNGN